MKFKGISAIIATLLILVITLGLAGLAYTYISRIFTARTRTLFVVDSFCYGTTARIVIRNEGPTNISGDSVKLVYGSGGTCSGSQKPSTFPPGEEVMWNLTGCESGKVHVYRLIGPASTSEVVFTCA
ncbi:MAG TPA: hypothetical protein ENF38_01520 [Candidatus Aenigmarchaeota archaeon]|nr:hypothetical protein [Candidatus Aenigmarchaeota archaeon]